MRSYIRVTPLNIWPNRVIKPRIRWTRHVAPIAVIRNGYKTLICKHEGKIYLGRTKHINGKIILTICLKYINNVDMNDI
jgi:hypothetical protein